MIMQSAFFHLTNIIPEADAVKYLKDANEQSYGRKGQNIVDMNNAAVDAGIAGAVEVPVPEEWAHATEGGFIAKVDRPEFVRNVCDVMNRQEGDDLPFPRSKAGKTVLSLQAHPITNVLPRPSRYRNGFLKTVFPATSVLLSAPMPPSAPSS